MQTRCIGRIAMEIMDAARAAITDLIVPELHRIKEENLGIKTMLSMTNKRLDDVNLHLADQSRRIDETNKRFDEVNRRIDASRDELLRQLVEHNKRMDRLYEVIVGRDEHSLVVERVAVLEREMSEIKRRLAV
jgi:hypothetical protein